MKELFGIRSDGRESYLYTIRGGGLVAKVSDHGATLVRLFVPDGAGQLADVVLGMDTPDGYDGSTAYYGATVGRNANRVCKGEFVLNGKTVQLEINNGRNNLHGGFSPYGCRLWQVAEYMENTVRFHLESPDGDQGFPGKASVDVTYSLEAGGVLRIIYDAVSDQDTVFNMTNHSYFNLAGHEKPELAMGQELTMPARFFCVDDSENIPTGECRDVAGTPMDFRTPCTIGERIGEDYEPLHLQGGYDHNFEVFANPCAILRDPASGRYMSISTDCPGIQLYSGNFLPDEAGKDGVVYGKRGGVALETQFYPDSVNHPEWKQPFFQAGQRYHSETVYRFWAE